MLELRPKSLHFIAASALRCVALEQGFGRRKGKKPAGPWR
jgi:hypothetical protein